MTRRNPFEEIEEWIDRMSQQVESGDWGSFGGGGVLVDLIDTGEAYEIHADLPGYDRDDISLTLADGTLAITAERESTTETGDEQFVRRERRHNRVSRTIRLPEPIDEESTSAKYDNGVLTIHLTKEHTTESGQQIDIE